MTHNVRNWVHSFRRCACSWLAQDIFHVIYSLYGRRSHGDFLEPNFAFSDFHLTVNTVTRVDVFIPDSGANKCIRTEIISRQKDISIDSTSESYAYDIC